MTGAEPSDMHLTPEQTAGYLDGVLTTDERAVVEAHLDTCFECRDEVVALRPVIRARNPRRWLLPTTVTAGAAAAAALVLLVQSGRLSGPEPSLHRDPWQEATPVLVPKAPAGMGVRPALLAWSPLPQASKYRVHIFDAEGTILFQTEAADSLVKLPDSIGFSPGQPYFWKVEADTGWDRWVSSDLVEFSIKTPPREEP